MHPIARIPWLTLPVLLLLVVGVGACRRSESNGPQQPAPGTTAVKPAGSPRSDNILFITVDTTRADRIGCYGYDHAVTPTFDALAERGTLFEQAIAQVQLTLPSHSTMMTGKYPREHGVLNNGRSSLGPDHVTLAQRAKERGYQTGAFVGAYVLDGKFGLARHFDVYDDDMGSFDPTDNPLHRERPADVVTDSAIEWLQSVKSEPFFAWVHYFDPHDPYEPPGAFRNVGVDHYDGEVAFMDSQMGRLINWLSESDLNDNTLVVVAGDHGESFGEHGEHGHTIFLYETNLHVPMIFVHPELVQSGARVAGVVELGDIFPTILDLMNWSIPAEVSARSLARSLAGEAIDPKPAYSESLYVLQTYGWAEQRALTTERWKYISSARPELYDRLNDPHETKNLINENPDQAGEMSTALESLFAAMIPGEAVETVLQESERQKLAALGYLSAQGLTSDDFLTPGLLDPKDNLDVIELAKVARGALREQSYEMVLSLLRPVSDRAEKSTSIQLMLGEACLGLFNQQLVEEELTGDRSLLTRARQAFERVINLDQKDFRAVVGMAEVLAHENNFADALEHFELALSLSDNKSLIHVRIAQLYHEQSILDKASEHFRKAIEFDPSLGGAHFGLGSLYFEQSDFDTAHQYFRDAVRHTPDDAAAHYQLGLTLMNLGKFDEAIVPFRTAIELKDDYKEATINLGISLYLLGRTEEAKDTFIAATRVPTMAPEAWYNLAVIAEREGNPARGIELHERALQLRPDYEDPVQALAIFYLRDGVTKEAVRVLRIGVEQNPHNIKFLNMLAKLLATSEQDDVRNGRDALELASQAAQLTQNRHPSILQTLAAAYAELGRMDKAMETAQRAISLARAANDDNLAFEIEVQLEGYREGRAARAQGY